MNTIRPSRTARAEDAADLTQQVFLHAWEALPLYEERRLPAPTASGAAAARSPLISCPKRPSRSIRLIRRPACCSKRRWSARDLLLELHAADREPLVLRFVGELTLREIGLIVGKSESAVQRRLVRLLHQLKEWHRELCLRCVDVLQGEDDADLLHLMAALHRLRNCRGSYRPGELSSQRMTSSACRSGGKTG